MKFEFNVEEKDMYGCYKAFFAAKQTKFNKFFRWFMFSLVVLLLAGFITCACVGEWTLFWQTGIILVVFTLITFLAFFNQKLLLHMSKKNYQKTQLNISDRVIITINGKEYKEEVYSGEKLLSLLTYDIDTIGRLEEDDDNFYIMFGLGSASIIKKEGVAPEILTETGKILYEGLKTTLRRKKNAQAIAEAAAQPKEDFKEIQVDVSKEKTKPVTVKKSTTKKPTTKK